MPSLQPIDLDFVVLPLAFGFRHWWVLLSLCQFSRNVLLNLRQLFGGILPLPSKKCVILRFLYGGYTQFVDWVMTFYARFTHLLNKMTPRGNCRAAL